MRRFLVPLLVFGVLVVFLALGLRLKPSEVPSPLIDKPAPAFTLPQLEGGQPWSPSAMRGKVWLLNVWASWCPSCLHEHPVLLDYVRKPHAVPLVGLNYKDQPGDAKEWLQKHGDPYVLSVSDLKGLVGIDYGVYGAPETYLIDAQGVIRYKHIGPVTPEVLSDKIVPLAKRLQP
jgi:cytochrome c biogenesis protein CcmG, thiol:disulfide interchange protein DsbE